jgi:uncharacterized protein involved in outer membrane biogenesis
VKLPRWTHWVGGILAVVVGVVGTAVYLATRYFDRERITGLVAAEVRKATGREIHFDGPIGFRFLPSLTLTLEGTRLANADWGTRPDMLEARRLDLEVALQPLLSKRLEIRRVVFDGVALWLETSTDGRRNWVMQGEPVTSRGEAPAPHSRPLAIDLARADIRDTTIALHDGKTGDTETLGLERVSLSSDGPTDKIEAQVRLREQPLSIKGHIGKVAALLAGADSRFALDLTLALDGATLVVNGGIGLGAKAGTASLDFDGDIRDSAALAKLVGSELPLPLPLRFSGHLEQDGMRSLLPAFKLTAAGQALGGKGLLDASGQRPRLELAAQADAFDVDALLPAAAHTAAPRPASGGRVFSDQRLPIPALPALDARIDMVVGKLHLRGMPPVSAVHATLTLNQGQVALQPLVFRLGSGGVDAMATLQVPTGRVPSISVHLRSAGTTLQEWLALTGGTRKVRGGRAELALELQASGHSAHELARTLNGELRLEVGPMQLSGDLGGDLLTQIVDAVNPFHKQDQVSSLNCAAMRLPVRQGAIVVDRSIAVESDKLNVVVAGKIDLGAESVDLAIRPTIKEGIGVGTANLAQLVRLSGSLSDPRIGVNMQGAARQGLSIGAAVATGGLSLVGERLIKERADPHPCVAAIRAQPAASPPPKAADAAPTERQAKRRGIFR